MSIVKVSTQVWYKVTTHVKIVERKFFDQVAEQNLICINYYFTLKRRDYLFLHSLHLILNLLDKHTLRLLARCNDGRA